jgi:pyruvate formate lyase activating enzyme
MKACKTKEATGNIHSIETFGTHDGPGIRFVLFMQGCMARCLYCQNPDTWADKPATYLSPEEVFDQVERCMPYIKASRGGITVSGGEPLLQIGFLQRLFEICRKNGIHTAVDTSAFYRSRDRVKLKRLMKLTDLFILDIKAAREDLHRKITSMSLDMVLEFIELLEESEKTYWIRYVLVPGLNDSSNDIKDLARLTGSLRHCERFEFLPYHELGRHKWEYMGMSYPLARTRPATGEDVGRAEFIFSDLAYFSGS